MKTIRPNNKCAAMTLFEVLLVLAIVMLLVMILLPMFAAARRNSSPISCVNNLKQVGLAFRIWQGDNNDKYPMAVSVTNGGAMELIATGNVAVCFQVMSNELSTPLILLCPDDKQQVAATNFTTNFGSHNISYFIGVDTTEANPQMFLAGDDNFSINGVAVKSGLAQFSTNDTVVWTAGRHTPRPEHFWSPTSGIFFGNTALGDGSVQQFSQTGLQQAIAQTGVTTNRLAIP